MLQRTPGMDSDDHIEAVALELDPEIQSKLFVLRERKIELYSAPIDELKADWECVETYEEGCTKFNTYKSLYALASTFRGAGKHHLASLLFKEAYDIVILVKSKRISSPAIFIREASCHDSRVRCNNALQVNQLQSLNELHQLSCSIFEELRFYVELTKKLSEFRPQTAQKVATLKQEYERAEELLDTLELLFGQKNAIDIAQLTKFIELLHEYHKSNDIMSVQAKSLWKISFYLTRLSLILNSFYQECTDHFEKADEMADITTKAAEIAVWYRSKVDDKEIENDKLGILPTLSDLTKWCPMYKHMLASSANEMKQTGEYEMPMKSDRSLTDFLDNYKVPEDLEGAVAVEAQRLFNSAIADEKYYSFKLLQLEDLYIKLPQDPQFRQAAMQIKIFQARAALHFISSLEINSLEDIENGEMYYSNAKEAYEQAETLSQQIEGGRNHILNKWLSVVKAQLILIKFRINAVRGEVHADVLDMLGDSERDPEEKETTPLDVLHSVEDLFPDYQIPLNEVAINRQKVAYLPQEAEINYHLGVIEFEKAKLFADELKTLKTSDYEEGDPDMYEKILCFEKARGRLCTAYNILRDLGSNDQESFGKIARCYRELIYFNYKISGVPESEIDGMLDFDMARVSQDYQLESWTNAYHKLVREQRFADEELFSARLSESLETAARQFAPMVRKLVIYKEGASIDDERYMKAINNNKTAVTSDDEVGEDSVFDVCSPDFDYYDEDGFITVVSLADNPEFKLIIETEYPLKDSMKKKFSDDIGEGVILLFELNQLQRTDTSEMTDDEIEELDIQCLESTWEDHQYLMRKHPETLEHEENVSKYLLKAVEAWNESHSNTPINTKYVKYLGLLHDTGKANPAIDPHLILNKRWKLLPFERKKVEWHGAAGPDYLRGRLKLERFRDFIAIIASHHVKYFGKGYPISLNGSDIFDINEHLLHLYTNVSESERLFLQDAKLSFEDAVLARLIVIIDVFEALTSNLRAYRKPMILKILFGIFNSDKGEHFDPYIVDFFIKAFNEGVFDEFLDYEPYKEEVEQGDFEAEIVDCYSLDLLYQFVTENREELSVEFDLDFNRYIEHLKKGKGKNLSLSVRQIRSNMFEGYKGQYDFQTAKSKDIYCDWFVEFFINWVEEQGHGAAELTPLAISQEEWEEISQAEPVAS